MFSYVTSAPCLFFRRIQNSVSQNANQCLYANQRYRWRNSYCIGFATCTFKFAPTLGHWARCLLAKFKTCTFGGASVKQQEIQCNIVL